MLVRDLSMIRSESAALPSKLSLTSSLDPIAANDSSSIILLSLPVSLDDEPSLINGLIPMDSAAASRSLSLSFRSVYSSLSRMEMPPAAALISITSGITFGVAWG